MLKLYRRHLKACPHRSMTYRRCKCPVWVFGSVRGDRIRYALGTASWDKAEEMLRAQDPLETPAPAVTLSDAWTRFISDCESRKLATETIAKYELLMKEMNARLGNREVRAITVDDLAKYRETWKASAITAVKKLERLRAFFRFSQERGWCSFNPAVGVRKPKARFRPTLPFTNSEVEKILWATEVYPIKGIYGAESRKRIRAFVRLLLYSGLRIRDAVTMEFSQFNDEGKLLLYTQKTGQPVFLPLPLDVVKEVLALRKGDEKYAFWSGRCNPKSAVGDWQRSLRKLFKLAGMKGHAHMFRDTMAVRLLEKGVPLETVAVILGNSVKVCEKHYAPWVQSRQLALEDAVKRTWV